MLFVITRPLYFSKVWNYNKNVSVRMARRQNNGGISILAKIKVNFKFDDKVYEAESGARLSDVCEAAGYSQDLVCGGNGKCGKCTVEIAEAGVEKTVLSCRYELKEDIDVLRIFNRANRKVNVLTSNSDLHCNINPQLEFLHVKGSDIEPGHCSSFMERIYDQYKLKITYPALKKLSFNAQVHKDDRDFYFVIFDDKIIDVNTDNDEMYGLAVDIGSTTVAAYLYDMKEAKQINIYSSLNEQTTLGADVISRIGYCIDNEDGTEVMRHKVCDTVNSLLKQARERDGIDTNKIYHAVFCGNSTMQHLFLGLYPGNLGRAPFVSTTHAEVDLRAEDTPLDLNPECVVTFLPLLGGFVGADTTAVLIGLPDDDKLRLTLDLGTNGELAVGNDENCVIASTACGPALEGAGLSCGMRAAEGALQHFKINDDGSIYLDVIGDVPATGICGSGIIDILGEMARTGLINKRGKMLSAEEYTKKFGENAVTERIVTLESGVKAFLVSAGDVNVYFTQMDVREVQKAKGAIAAGCVTLLKVYGIDPHELTEICLAGAFGNYLDVENAQRIGLFPRIEGVPVRSIGNGAGTGVQMFLLDKASVKKCLKVQKNARHIELDFQEGFSNTLFDQMLFKEARE